MVPPSLYLAQISAGRVEVWRDDRTWVDAFAIPPGAGLRKMLAEHGWRPTGHRADGGGWSVLVVEPITRR